MPKHHGVFAVAENFGFYLNFGSCKQCLLAHGAGPFPKLTGYRKTSSREELRKMQVTQHHPTGLWKGCRIRAMVPISLC